MHLRITNSKSKSNNAVRVKGKQKGIADSTTGGSKQRRPRPSLPNQNRLNNMRSSSRHLHGILSWLGSFTKLFLVIGFFVTCVYLYDKRIIYGFAEEAGWIDPKSERCDEDTGKCVTNSVDLWPVQDPSRHSHNQQPSETEGSRQTSTIENNIKEIRHGNEVVGLHQKEETRVTFNNERDHEEHVNAMIKDGSNEKPHHYHILQVLTNTHQKPHLKTRFDVCIRSILSKSSVNLHFFFVADKPSEQFIIDCLQQITDEGISKSHFQFTILLIETLGQELLPYVGDLQAQLRGGHPYYQDAIFFLSLGIHHEILPDNVKQLIIMDTDLKFMSDIEKLFQLFDNFSDDNVMGIAHEQQPVYRHLFSLFRSQNRGTKVGDPPPDGLTGFNSGVMLLDLIKMRGSKAYNEILTIDFIKKYAEKYHFKGHLGDQDFFSLACMEKPDLFYVLPCSWNKQLCVWWKDKGYQDVFDLYFNCPQPIHVYHGNCNTPITY